MTIRWIANSGKRARLPASRGPVPAETVGCGARDDALAYHIMEKLIAGGKRQDAFVTRTTRACAEKIDGRKGDSL
jgi:hypothetical protein